MHGPLNVKKENIYKSDYQAYQDHQIRDIVLSKGKITELICQCVCTNTGVYGIPIPQS